jgi:predicted anti-sigma-YlaC factor YlaD
MLDCRQATELAQAGLDRPLSAWARCKLALHRLVCEPCRIYKRQVVQLRRLTAGLRDTAEPSPQLDSAARERIRARLRDGSPP